MISVGSAAARGIRRDHPAVRVRAEGVTSHPIRVTLPQVTAEYELPTVEEFSCAQPPHPGSSPPWPWRASPPPPSPLPATAATQAQKHHLRYVALGDSYSAASGNVPPDPSAAPQCLRSTINYPHLIAAKTHATLHDVTCGGAEDSDYFSSQYQGVPAQLKAVHKNTQLVTMTIGGNDSGVFIDSIAECAAAGTSSAGQGHPCKDKYGNSFDKTIRTKTYPAIVKSLKAVHRKAPHARVAILTYPWILPKTKGCFPTMPVAKGDVPLPA